MAGLQSVKEVAARVRDRIPPQLRLRLSQVWEVISRTISICFRYRVTGLAAEAAFFAVLSLPPLIFALIGAVGFVAQRYDVATLEDFREEVLTMSSRALTPDAVDTLIKPTLDDVLSGGRFDIISIGFVLAVWSGSRALNVLVDTITIMYGLAGLRNVVKTRLLSFGLYAFFLVIGAIVLPLVLAGPTLVDHLLPTRLEFLNNLYWPIVLAGTACVLAGLFHLSVPVRTRWISEMPGAGLTLVIWLGGNWVLRAVLIASAGSTTIYGPLAAPIAFLIWTFVTAMAVLIGAACNAAIDFVWPRLSGIEHLRTYRATTVPANSPRLREAPDAGTSTSPNRPEQPTSPVRRPGRKRPQPPSA
ncbi:MAG: YihY/virulence factor BrkB family protein [Microlunatus sp.]